MQLKGKVAIVTGAGSGIGRAIAHRFAKEGASVVIAARSSDGKTVEQEIKRKGGKAFFVKTDVSQNASVKAMVAKAIKQFKRIDILINNAGIMMKGDVVNFSEADWDKTIDVNLKSIFLCGKYVVPVMRKQKRGVIINLSSEWGLFGGRGVVAYCASKGGVVNITKAMALDHAREGIRVNCICPGPIMTNMLTNFFTKPELGQIAQIVPLGRIGKPEEIANLALFLASEEASFITGSIYSADGGDTSGYYA